MFTAPLAASSGSVAGAKAQRHLLTTEVPHHWAGQMGLVHRRKGRCRAHHIYTNGTQALVAQETRRWKTPTPRASARKVGNRIPSGPRCDRVHASSRAPTPARQAPDATSVRARQRSRPGGRRLHTSRRDPRALGPRNRARRRARADGAVRCRKPAFIARGHCWRYHLRRADHVPAGPRRNGRGGTG